jgi:uncharacterized DUF497 family protein
MKVEFDPAKRAITLADRGLDFLDAPLVIENSITTFEDTRFDYEETRLVTYGRLNERLVAVIWVKVEDGIRVISMRKANDREQKRYQG